jgi:hypothetical protein
MKKCLPFILIAIAFSCGKDETETCVTAPDVSSIELNVIFESFEDTVTNFRTKAELVDFFTRQPVMRDYFFKRTSYLTADGLNLNDSVFVNTIYNRFKSPAFDTLLLDTRKVFTDLSSLKGEFTEAFKIVKYHYPDFTPPKVQTIISGLDNDLFVSDSLIIVSLDAYLGPGARYRPNTYDYILRQYVKENIVPSCMLLYGIGDRFNKTDLQDKTVLADMIAYGKAYYFAKHTIPCVADSILTWYTPEEIEGSEKNQDLIWARFIEDKVLFSTSHVIKQKYLSERPKTLEVGEKCPGRIGRWIGWQIVNSYMGAHPETTLNELMNMKNAQKIFKESKYKPERN